MSKLYLGRKRSLHVNTVACGACIGTAEFHAGVGVSCTWVPLLLWLQEKNLDWFPRMRAMSLAADDSEGEQNELRNLQIQLESTNSLVKTLSTQLAELKEQVGTKYVVVMNTFWLP